jgi:crotonobetaine/carnitine-CoA ligase
MKTSYYDSIWKPEKDLSLWHILIETGKQGGHIVVGDRKQSYRELADRANALAGGLKKRGVRRGDRVAFVMLDRMEIVELLFAAVRLGAILVPINPYLKGRFMRHQLELSEPSVIVVDRPGLASIEEMTGNLQLLGIFSVEETLAVDSTLACAPLEQLFGDPVPDCEYDPDGRLPMAIMFTSGTTGPSKGCILSRGYEVKTGATLAKIYGLTNDDVVFSALPMFHSAALTCCLMEGIASGASVHLTGGFRASTFMIEAGEAGATVAVCIGAMGPMLLAQPPRETDTAHRLRILHIVPMSVATQGEFHRRFNVRPWTQSFGQTECMLIGAKPRDETGDPASCGRASEVVDLAILDDDGHPCPPGKGGEIAIRPKTSGAMFGGYWRNEQATLATWRDLWHHTGDNGFLDEKGFLHFLDRKKDAIRRRGENVSSIELEAAILEHPAIQAVAVHAMESGLSEDEIKACVILHQHHSVTPEAIFEFFKNTLPYFAIPRYVELFEEFPLTESMKVRKDALRMRGNSAACWDFEELGLRVGRTERRSAAASRGR